MAQLLLPPIHYCIFMLVDNQPPIVLTGLLLVVVLMVEVMVITDNIKAHIHMAKVAEEAPISVSAKIHSMLVL